MAPGVVPRVAAQILELLPIRRQNLGHEILVGFDQFQGQFHPLDHGVEIGLVRLVAFLEILEVDLGHCRGSAERKVTVPLVLSVWPLSTAQVKRFLKPSTSGE